MKKLLTVLAIWILMPVVSLAAEPRSHIEEVLAEFMAAFNSGDAATMASHYTEDGALFPPGADRVDGRAAIEAFWQGAIDSGMTFVELNTIEVDARGDLAAEVGEFILNVPGDDGSTNISGQYIVTWKRTGHTWQLHRDIWNTK